MNIKLALLLTGLVTTTAYAADAAGVVDDIERGQSPLIEFVDPGKSPKCMDEDERISLALKKSMETEAAEKNFRAKMAELLKGGTNKMGNVMFEALKFNVGSAVESNNVTCVQEMIVQVRNVQQTFQLTVNQLDEVDALLMSLASRLSELTTAEQLGATKRSAR